MMGFHLLNSQKIFHSYYMFLILSCLPITGLQCDVIVIACIETLVQNFE